MSERRFDTCRTLIGDKDMGNELTQSEMTSMLMSLQSDIRAIQERLDLSCKREARLLELNSNLMTISDMCVGMLKDMKDILDRNKG